MHLHAPFSSSYFIAKAQTGKTSSTTSRVTRSREDDKTKSPPAPEKKSKRKSAFKKAPVLGDAFAFIGRGVRKSSPSASTSSTQSRRNTSSSRSFQVVDTHARREKSKQLSVKKSSERVTFTPDDYITTLECSVKKTKDQASVKSCVDKSHADHMVKMVDSDDEMDVDSNQETDSNSNEKEDSEEEGDSEESEEGEEGSDIDSQEEDQMVIQDITKPRKRKEASLLNTGSYLHTAKRSQEWERVLEDWEDGDEIWSHIQTAVEESSDKAMLAALKSAERNERIRKRMIKYVGYAVVDVRYRMKKASREMVLSFFGLSSNIERKETLELVGWLQDGRHFHFGDLDLEKRTCNIDAPYQDPIIPQVLRAFLFSSSSKGDRPLLAYLKETNHVPIHLVAMVVTTIMHIFSEYASAANGTSSKLDYSGDNAGAEYIMILKSLQDMQKNSPEYTRIVTKNIWYLSQKNRGSIIQKEVYDYKRLEVIAAGMVEYEFKDDTDEEEVEDIGEDCKGGKSKKGKSKGGENKGGESKGGEGRKGEARKGEGRKGDERKKEERTKDKEGMGNIEENMGTQGENGDVEMGGEDAESDKILEDDEKNSEEERKEKTTHKRPGREGTETDKIEEDEENSEEERKEKKTTRKRPGRGGTETDKIEEDEENSDEEKKEEKKTTRCLTGEVEESKYSKRASRGL
ncbi:hypothetical protein K435DRAFT_859128 [Dendrothele bispora CBS 962.96]|uniref:DUF6532 domain-containing protein n=1 Tax=Dendrothele bispora (strain CBS 962.96) TaxID=1314807 RepID=A0A4S8M1B0_DENBC|nr:hypothetical protein K435DRAFT_859128 [Dendrothele bispora CBS 962.96]